MAETTIALMNRLAQAGYAINSEASVDELTLVQTALARHDFNEQHEAATKLSASPLPARFSISLM
jgi:hypothetical protein